MKKMLNTLYVTTETAYLSLDGENVVVRADDPESGESRELGRTPLHLLDGIVTFSYVGASPALLGKCAEYGKDVTFLTPSGKFLCRTVGKVHGNVLLRREQFRWADSPEKSLSVAQRMISAKLLNSAAVLRRAVSDHAERIRAEEVENAESQLRQFSRSAYRAESAESLRGLEGDGAQRYFAVFEELILQQRETFTFSSRNRRPPLDPVNAMLSFGYSLMTAVCSSALETFGLDPYVGFFHTDRPGRASLALDMLEEFRAPFVDRFVLTLINKRLVSDTDFVQKENGALLLRDESRREFLAQWQKKKREEIVHPYLGEKTTWGMLPFLQAQLLAKAVRGDLDDYPPFLWK